MLEFYDMLVEKVLTEATITKSQLKGLEGQLRKFVANMDYDFGVLFTNHFIDRAIERAETDDITLKELSDILHSAIDIYGDTMDTFDGKRFAGHFVDHVNNLDVPFALQIDTSRRYNIAMIPKTIVRRGKGIVQRGKFKDGAPALRVG